MAQSKERTEASDLDLARDGIREDISTKSRKSSDVIIVGVGVSGLYCAMKLLENHLELKKRSITHITILEKSNRLGGRLDTDIIKIPTEDWRDYKVKEEECAMRFTYNEDPDKSNMPTLARLINELGMQDKIVRFYMKPQPRETSKKSMKTVVPNSNANFFLGKFFTNWYAEENPTLWKFMYDLKGTDGVEEGKSADAINQDIYRKLLDYKYNAKKVREHYSKEPEKAEAILANDLKDPQKREKLQEYLNVEYWSFVRNEFKWPVGDKEIVLHNFTKLGLMTAMGYSHGCIKMMRETEGFELFVQAKGNVGVFLQDSIFYELVGDRVFQFKKGWSHFIKKLVKHLRWLADPPNSHGIHLHIHKKSDVSEFVDTDEGFKLKLLGGDEHKAKHVVMAVAPIALEKILLNTKYWSILLDNELLKICKSSIGIQLMKINLYYKDDWWNQVENTCMFGPSTTDLPCAQLYPFYSDCKASGCLGCDTCFGDPCPAALTIYCDENRAMFWSSLQRLGPLFMPKLQEDHEKLQAASIEVVKEARKQFAKIFNIDIAKIPEPVLTSYRSWDGQDRKTNPKDSQKTEYQFAIHMWGIGVDDREIRDQAAQPVKGKNLFLCNEAWSGYQGWVEGALQSTEKAVKALLAPEQEEQHVA